MPYVPVNSSQIKELEYDSEANTLHVRFHCRSCESTGTDKSAKPCSRCSGRGYNTYRYIDVPSSKYEAVRDANGSVGNTFNTLIKSAKDPHTGLLVHPATKVEHA